MKKRIQQLLAEAKSKLNGYVGLLMLRYANLCVKAEAASLLPVTVAIDDEEHNIEDVAKVGIPKENVLAVIPNDTFYLYDIGKSVLLAHPEFKMDIVQNENNKDDEEDKYLTFTMPDVNKDRYDVLTNGVKGLHDQCKAKMDVVLQQYTAQIGAELLGADEELINTVKDKLKEFHDFYNKTMQDQTDDNLKEIEDAYQRYLAEQQQKEQEQKEQEEAHGLDKGMSMQMS